MNPGARLEPIRRLTWLGAGLLLWGAAILGKLISLQVVHHNTYLERALRQQEHTIPITAPRGTIFDRNGEKMAMSVPVESIAINPRLVPDKSIAAEVLAPVLGLDTRVLYSAIVEAANQHRGFLFIKRKISLQESDRLHAMHADWILFQEDSKRIYPNNSVAAHVVGSVYQGEKGAEGIEKGVDEALAGTAGTATIMTDVKRRGIDSWVDRPAVAGKPLRLTIDDRLQFMAERELAAQVIAKHARTGTAIVMNPYTGEILVMANYPTFDPNKPPMTSDERRAHFNLGAQVPFEPGSIFKVVTLSTALETTNLRPESMIDCHHGILALPGRVVHEAHKGWGMLSMADVLAHSSNIGAIEIGARIGREKFYQYLTNFGFGQRTGLPLPAESKGILRKLPHWGTTSLASVSMGQEVGTTSLQLIRADAAVANGGLLVTPKLVTEIDGHTTPTEQPKRVLRPETAATMRALMLGVVLNGTGRTIRLNGWSDGGKTGTAQIFENGHYTHLYNASFMGFAPVNKPALVAIVTINGTAGEAGMGALAAGPVWVKIMNEALRMNNVPKDLPEMTVPNVKPVPDETLEVADVEGVTGPNILDDDPSAMPKLTDVPMEREQGAEVAPPAMVAEQKAAAKGADAAMPAKTDAPVVAAYNGPVVPDFRGKPMRTVVKEAYSQGLSIRPEGTGVARAQAPAAGTPLIDGATVRVLFAR